MFTRTLHVPPILHALPHQPNIFWRNSLCCFLRSHTQAHSRNTQHTTHLSLMHTEQTLLSLNRLYALSLPHDVYRLTVHSHFYRILVLAQQISSVFHAYASAFQHYRLRHWRHCFANKLGWRRAHTFGPSVPVLFTWWWAYQGWQAEGRPALPGGGGVFGISTYLHLKDVNCMVFIVLYFK